MKWILIIPMALLGSGVAAQDTPCIKLHQDPRLDSLVKKQVEINEYNLRHTRRIMPGFRILVLSTNDRNKVVEAKTKLFREFPELKSYLSFQSPYFKLKVGDFTERENAESYLKDLQQVMSGPVYIVHDLVEATGEQLLNN